jgi:hypothetical protein
MKKGKLVLFAEMKLPGSVARIKIIGNTINSHIDRGIWGCFRIGIPATLSRIYLKECYKLIA